MLVGRAETLAHWLNIFFTKLSNLVSVGVLAGCLLGMSCLLFIDTDAAERARRAKELESIFINTVHQGRTRFGAERATLYLLDERNKEIWSQVSSNA